MWQKCHSESGRKLVGWRACWPACQQGCHRYWASGKTAQPHAGLALGPVRQEGSSRPTKSHKHKGGSHALHRQKAFRTSEQRSFRHKRACFRCGVDDIADRRGVRTRGNVRHLPGPERHYPAQSGRPRLHHHQHGLRQPRSALPQRQVPALSRSAIELTPSACAPPRSAPTPAATPRPALAPSPARWNRSPSARTRK